MRLLASSFCLLTNLDSSIMPTSLSEPTSSSSPQNQSLNDSKPTLLSIPQELRNRTVSAKYLHLPQKPEHTLLTPTSSATSTPQPTQSQASST
jgi:hypothetical protein